MDAESRANLDRILSVEPAALSEADIAFLRARESYLNDNEREAMKEVLGKPAKTKKSEDEK